MGWEPPSGWKPHPSWPKPPRGWQLWLDEPDDPFYEGVALVGKVLGGKQRHVLEQYSVPGQRPWFVFNAATNGVLVAYADRVTIMKVGAMTAFMSSATGGGRVTHFPFSDITTVEVNTGFVTAVIEILTPSYSGGQSNDFWKLADKLNAGNPGERSNTLPCAKLELNRAMPYLNELRRRIAEYKRPGQQPAPGQSMAGELARLAELRDRGVLSAEEFEFAKQAVLRKGLLS